MSLLVVGSVARDTIRTPHGEVQDALGGAAVYFSLAACNFTPVRLVGVVGDDFSEGDIALLGKRDIDLAGLQVVEGGRTFRWSGEYSEDMNSRETLSVELNVFEHFEPVLPADYTDSSFVFLANASPATQLSVLGQVESPVCVMADTMDLWIEIARKELEEVLAGIDLLVINETEAREYTGSTNLVTAGNLLRAKGPEYVVIKLGEFGAILFAPPECNHGLFRCGAFPLSELADPTGAGDTFLGAMAGYLASLGTTDYRFEQIRDAVVRGTVMASFTCEAFSTRRIEELSELELLERLEIFREMSCW